MNRKTIIIIGAGIGGLATAALLGKAGYKVIVFEKNKQVGGRASVWKTKGFTFDMGPSWYLMPDVFDRYFSYFGKKASDLLQLKRLDPHYRIYFGRKEFIDIVADMKKNNKLFETMETGSSKRIKHYLAKAKNDYEAAIQYILYKEFKSIKDFLTIDLMREGKKLNPLQNLDAYVKGIVSEKKLQQILMYPIVFLGGSPKKTPSFYSILSHVDFNLGVYYPMGGIYSIIKTLKHIAEKNNVTIHTGKSVSKIIVENGTAKGVQVNGKTHLADIVVSNADYAFTELHLLDSRYQTYSESYWKKRTIAPSAFIIYLGLNRKISSLQHHTLSFANNWEEHFDQLFSKPSYPEKPSYYICTPSKSDTSVAPKGCENMFVLVPISPFVSDTTSQRERYADFIIKEVESLTGESIREHIMVKRIFSIKDFKEQYNAYSGTALGLAHTLTQTALLRPVMKSKKVDNLYYVGQYTQPGIGMPMCLIAAELVAKRIQHEQ